jgi:hypothetical protein
LEKSVEFPPQFIRELNEILSSEAVSSYYDSAGEAAQSLQPFTGKWPLESLEGEPGSGQRRVVASFNGGDRIVKAVIDARDFPNLLHGEHDPVVNSTRYSDLAYTVSILLMEQILLLDPSDVKADEVHIRLPA